MAGQQLIRHTARSDSLQILIHGAGAIGCFLGARLALSGQKVVLVGRPALAAAVQSAGGLTLIEPGDRRRFAAGVDAATDAAAALAAHGPYDLALLTVKAYDTEGAADELSAAAGGRGGPVLTLQNGVGNEEVLARVFGADRVISGAIETPVSVPAPGLVQVHRGRYAVGLAPAGPAAPVDLAERALAGAGFTVGRAADYRSLKWSKLLMNLAANASCAILDWSPGQVMANPVTARLEARAWQEALAVMAALGIRPFSFAGYPLGLLAPVARCLPERILASGLRRIVSGGRGSKLPSMLLALRSGRPSEVAWLNGAVARHAESAGIPAPTNAAYMRVLTALSAGRAPWDDYRNRPERLADEAQRA